MFCPSVYRKLSFLRTPEGIQKHCFQCLYSMQTEKPGFFSSPPLFGSILSLGQTARQPEFEYSSCGPELILNRRRKRKQFLKIPQCVWIRTKTQPHKNSCISLSSVAPEGTLSVRKYTLLCTPVQLKGALCSF